MLFYIALMAAAAQPQTQLSLDESAGRAAEQADAALNRQWRSTYAAMKRMDVVDPQHGKSGAGYAATLLASQRAWLRYRDAECVSQGMRFAGGSAQLMAVVDCRSALARQRTQTLRTLTK